MKTNNILVGSIFLQAAIIASAQTPYQSKFGNQEFKKRIAWLRENEVVGFDVFYQSVLNAFEYKEFDKIAEYIQYPIKIEVGKRFLSLKSKADFVKIAKKAIDKNFIKLILC